MMRFFNYDSSLMRFLTRLADVIILNILFIICCIPFITIGTALTAMYSVTLKMAGNREGYIFKSFFKAFKENFKICTLCWLLFSALAGIIYADIRLIPDIPGKISIMLKPAFFAVGIVLFIIFSYIFPYIARFENSLKCSLKNSFIIAILNLPYTILILAVSIIPFIFTAIAGIEKIGIFWIMLGFGLIAYVNSFIFRIIFYKYEPHDEGSKSGGEGA